MDENEKFIIDAVAVNLAGMYLSEHHDDIAMLAEMAFRGMLRARGLDDDKMLAAIAARARECMRELVAQADGTPEGTTPSTAGARAN